MYEVMADRNNLRRTVFFERPDYIPMVFHINPACWNSYSAGALEELMADHPFLFPGFDPAAGPVVPAYEPNQVSGRPFVDDWGCTWETPEDGITGVVTGHPLASWDALDSYRPPNPGRSTGLGPLDWAAVAADFEAARSNGQMTMGILRHGHTFLLLQDLRGYQNLIYDMADGDPRLLTLIEMVEAFNAGIVERYLHVGAEWMSYPEDLGMQVGPMVSPGLFRRYVKPSYQRLMQPARRNSKSDPTDNTFAKAG